MLIDCDACAVRGPACGDCVVSVLLSMPAAGTAGTGADTGRAPGVDLDQAEQAAIAVLAGSGLVPPLRLVPRCGVAEASERRPRATRTG
jgi:hypothetical protein